MLFVRVVDQRKNPLQWVVTGQTEWNDHRHWRRRRSNLKRKRRRRTAHHRRYQINQFGRKGRSSLSGWDRGGRALVHNLVKFRHEQGQPGKGLVKIGHKNYFLGTDLCCVQSHGLQLVTSTRQWEKGARQGSGVIFHAHKTPIDLPVGSGWNSCSFPSMTANDQRVCRQNLRHAVLLYEL